MQPERRLTEGKRVGKTDNAVYPRKLQRLCTPSHTGSRIKKNLALYGLRGLAFENRIIEKMQRLIHHGEHGAHGETPKNTMLFAVRAVFAVVKK